MDTMRAARLVAPGGMRIVEASVPVLGPDEALIRIAACGICGTDRHIFRGEYPARLPLTLGHEFSGTVVAASTGTAIEVGSRVTVDPNISCGRCRECRRGDTCLCPRRVALGVDLDGGMAEYARVPLSQLYELPDSISLEHAALCEPLACCLHGIDLAAIRPGMSVAVIGGGVIGQLMVQLARLAGASTVALITRQESRRRLAEALGATASIDPRAHDPVEAVAGAGGLAPRGVDVVLECAGTVETFEQSMALARRGGTVVVFGVAPATDLARISPYEIFARELRILGSYLNPHTHGRAIELIASGHLSLAPLITRRIALEETPTVIGRGPESGEVKTMIIR